MTSLCPFVENIENAWVYVRAATNDYFAFPTSKHLKKQIYLSYISRRLLLFGYCHIAVFCSSSLPTMTMWNSNKQLYLPLSFGMQD